MTLSGKKTLKDDVCLHKLFRAEKAMAIKRFNYLFSFSSAFQTKDISNHRILLHQDFEAQSSFSILLKKNCFSVKLLQSFSFFVCVNVSEAVSLVTLFVATSFH